MKINVRDSASQGAVFQYVSTAIILVSGVVFYTFLMHLFTPLLVGSIVLVITITQILSSVFYVPFYDAASHFISYYIDDKQEISWLVTNFTVIGLILSIISLLLLYLISPVLSMLFFHSDSYVPVLRIASVYLSASIFAKIVSGLAYGMQKFRRVSSINAISSVIGFSLATVFAIFFDRLSLIIIGLLAGQVFIIISLLPDIPQKSRSHLGGKRSIRTMDLLKYAAPFVVMVVVGSASDHVDKLITAFFLNVPSVGIYNLSLLISTGLFGSFRTINQILIPKFSEIYARGDIEDLKSNVDRSSRILSSLYIPVSLFLIAVSKPLVYLLGGPDYGSAILPLDLLLLLTAMSLPSIILSAIIASVRQTKIAYLTSPLSLATNIGLSVALIPTLGILGASIGFGFMLPIRAIILYVYVKKKGMYNVMPLPILKVWAISLIMLALIVLVELILGDGVLSLLYLVPLGVFMYIILLRASHILSKDDARLIADAFPARYRGLREKIQRILSG